jgi:hypothetical protein
VRVPWELTLLVTWRSPLSDVLTLNITPGPMGCPPPPAFWLQLLVASSAKWPLNSASAQRRRNCLLAFCVAPTDACASSHICLVFVAIEICVEWEKGPAVLNILCSSTGTDVSSNGTDVSNTGTDVRNVHGLNTDSWFLYYQHSKSTRSNAIDQLVYIANCQTISVHSELSNN